MPTTIFDGPLAIYGNMGNLQSPGGTIAVSDPNTDRGPSLVFEGIAEPDIRFSFLKDKVEGYTGMVPSLIHNPFSSTTEQIPTASAANNIAAAQGVASGTAMTLAAASLGVTLNVPLVPINGIGDTLNGLPVVTAAVALDFGFAFGNCTAGSTTLVVADATQFITGMPLVVGGVGNAAGTTPLLTNVASITDSTHIVVFNAPLATNTTAPIATGNIWGPSENGYPVPTAAMPYWAKGPGLFMDPRQSVARGVQIVGATGGTGGTFLVSGWDVYGDSMTELVTVGAGAVTGWGKKAFKYIASVVPQFSDAGHNYTVGTSDVFGIARFSGIWEYTRIAWAGAFMTSATGWLAGDTTSPSTSTTGDVRGTVQTSANGGGTGIGANASNGALTGLALTGRRLFLSAETRISNLMLSTITNPSPLFGVQQN